MLDHQFLTGGISHALGVAQRVSQACHAQGHHGYWANTVAPRLKSMLLHKDLWLPVDEKLATSQQCVLAAHLEYCT